MVLHADVRARRRKMIIAAILFPVMLAFSALAVEGGLWFADQHQLRNIADTAALAAGWARREGMDEQDAALAALADTGFNDDTDSIELLEPPTSGPFTGDDQAIEVVVHRNRPIVMSRLFLASATMSIAGRAVVQLGEKSGFCVLALHPTASGAIKVMGTADIDFNGCGVNVNSNASDGLNLGGGSLLNVQWADVTGGIDFDGGGTLISAQDPRTAMPSRPDPYEDIALPSSGACNYSSLQINNSATLNPGRYCAGLRFGSHAHVIMNPGTYIIDGGSLRANSGAIVVGDGVTFILTGSGTNYAQVDFNGGASLSFTAPVSGEYAGFVVLQDHRAPAGGANSFNGGAGMNIDGIIYLPNQNATFNGGSDVGTRCTRLVASTITFSGNANLGNDCSGLGIPEEIDDAPKLVG